MVHGSWTRACYKQRIVTLARRPLPEPVMVEWLSVAVGTVLNFVLLVFRPTEIDKTMDLQVRPRFALFDGKVSSLFTDRMNVTWTTPLPSPLPRSARSSPVLNATNSFTRSI